MADQRSTRPAVPAAAQTRRVADRFDQIAIFPSELAR
jgi:hypothetical protein